MDPKIISLLVFFAAYILFVIFPGRRTLFAALAAIVLILSGVLSIRVAFSAINWNVMGLFIGMGLVAHTFMRSSVPAYLAEIIVDRSKNTSMAMLFICIFTGFISAFVDNTATVLIVAPVAVSLAKKLKISLVELMIGIAVSSNLQGTATLIGDPPSMLLGGFAKMTFWDFFFYKGKPGIFWAVQIGAVASFMVLFIIFERYREKIRLIKVEKVKSWIPTILLLFLILFLALSSFAKTSYPYLAGTLCIVFGIISAVWSLKFFKSSLIEEIKGVEWETVFFLAGIFVLIGALTAAGWVDRAADLLSGLMGKNVFLGYTLIVFVSVFLSAFIDNIPYLATMLPITAQLAERLSIEPSLFFFGLLIGCSLGGNITPIGASANVAACSILKREGHPVKFGEFMWIGIPFTLSAVAAAYLFIWFVWK